MTLIRPAVPPDAPAILGLLRALAEELGEGRKFRSTERAIQSHGFGAKRLFSSVLAIKGGVAVGVAVFFPIFSTTRGVPGVYVQDLYVAPEERRRQLGRRLLAAAIREAKAGWGARYLMLMVYDSNSRARAFYAREGFSLPDSERPALLDRDAFEKLAAVT